MKNIVKKIAIITFIVALIGTIGFQNITYAGFADFDDETADRQANEDLKQQELEDEKNVGKSSNNYLSDLSVEGYKLTPVFDKQIINYSIEEEITENTIKINAVKDDERASVSGIGEINLQTGENNIRIDVKAENGVERAYFIKVVKKIDVEDLKLSSLKLTAISNNGEREELYLNKDFSSDIFLYSCNVYSDINKIELDAVSEKEDANITIQGNENLQEGQNIITVTLKDSSDNETIYKIQVNKQYSTSSEIREENSNKTVLFIVILFILVVIVFIVFFNKNSRKSKKRK